MRKITIGSMNTNRIFIGKTHQNSDRETLPEKLK